MTACDLERRTDGHPVCFTHKRSVQECLAAKDSEIKDLRIQLGSLAFYRETLPLIMQKHDAARAEAEKLMAILRDYLDLKNPNGKAYTRRLQELHADTRRALGKDGP